MTPLDLVSGDTTVVLAVGEGMPEIVSIGAPAGDVDLELWARAVPAGGALDAAEPLGIIAEHASGHSGRPGLIGSRPDGSAWAPRFSLVGTTADGPAAASFELVDAVAGLRLHLGVRVGDVVHIAAAVVNEGTTSYTLQRLAPSVPVPAQATELLTFAGRWCREFQPERMPFRGVVVVENRRGRTSHQRVPALFAGTSGFSEEQGRVWGVQLAWSGNHEIAAEALANGARHLQVGELLHPGEVRLQPGERYEAPPVVVSWSATGLNDASRRFHRAARAVSPSNRPRPVMLNTWEAVYFDHDLATLTGLADVAAAVGVERFVLDDGWFGGRRDDTAGLGDWWVSEAVWPDGLGPIIDHVTAAGMDFGLWVEPEMVNPDSDLYRAHPEWTLTTDGYDPLFARNQLVLDFGRPEVREHIFAAIDDLLTAHAIAYLKWDMNRDIVQGSHHGRAGTHGHVLGLYEVIDRLRRAHPTLEIESCSSGGGRVDLGILARTDRVWTSDTNDAVERQRIQRGFSMLFPPEVMGAHIGPERAATTRRRQDLGFRAATAVFGHLGIEWNLLRTTADERTQLRRVIDAHKRLRPLLHAGDVVRVDHPDPSALVHGVVAPDRSRAVYAYVQLEPSPTTIPVPMRFAGLDPDRRYRVAVNTEIGGHALYGRTQPAWISGERLVSGRQLVELGAQPPAMHPESVLIVEVEAVD